ncbi:MAG TPA: NDMA-dependent alcohol dehydrogenase [Trebonia sp.]|jgi:S-(hydroxymethyl)glutathione dehydrogenase/alcohol dehydrogenase
MKTKAAVLYEAGQPMEIEELEVAGPRAGQVLVRFHYAGLCHSDVHVQHGDMDARLPMVLGHEGSGIVEDIGPGVDMVKVGDHVVASFIPCCGRCRWCSSGKQSICDLGATILEGCLPDASFPLTGPKGNYGAMCMVGTFSQYGTLDQASVVPIDDQLPLDKAALVSCGVPTGWGSAVNAAEVRPGDTVLVVGIGGIGVNAVQGARFAGARHVVAVDPVPFKRDRARDFGATHSAASGAEAQALIQELTYGVGADSAILAVGLMQPEIVRDGFNTIRKGGTVVVTGLNKFGMDTIDLPGAEMTLFRKTVRGTVFGDCNPRVDIARLLGLYADGLLNLDDLITNTYSLDQVNLGYDDLLAGKNIRGLLTID